MSSVIAWSSDASAIAAAYVWVLIPAAHRIDFDGGDNRSTPRMSPAQLLCFLAHSSGKELWKLRRSDNPTHRVAAAARNQARDE